MTKDQTLYNFLKFFTASFVEESNQYGNWRYWEDPYNNLLWFKTGKYDNVVLTGIFFDEKIEEYFPYTSYDEFIPALKTLTNNDQGTSNK